MYIYAHVNVWITNLYRLQGSVKFSKIVSLFLFSLSIDPHPGGSSGEAEEEEEKVLDWP